MKYIDEAVNYVDGTTVMTGNFPVQNVFYDYIGVNYLNGLVVKKTE